MVREVAGLVARVEQHDLESLTAEIVDERPRDLAPRLGEVFELAGDCVGDVIQRDVRRCIARLVGKHEMRRGHGASFA